MLFAIVEGKHSPTGNRVFQLNIKSAALWSDLSEKCSVSIENSLTGQTIHVPVRIRIVGQAAKQVYNGKSVESHSRVSVKSSISSIGQRGFHRISADIPATLLVDHPIDDVDMRPWRYHYCWLVILAC